jgi:hypothetical protein
MYHHQHPQPHSSNNDPKHEEVYPKRQDLDRHLRERGDWTAIPKAQRRTGPTRQHRRNTRQKHLLWRNDHDQNYVLADLYLLDFQGHHFEDTKIGQQMSPQMLKKRKQITDDLKTRSQTSLHHPRRISLRPPMKTHRQRRRRSVRHNKIAKEEPENRRTRMKRMRYTPTIAALTVHGRQQARRERNESQDQNPFMNQKKIR